MSTTITPAEVKVGDLIAITTTVKVEEVAGRLFGGPSASGEYMRYAHTDIEKAGRTITLVDRPLPPEPPIGSVVIFRYRDGLEAWKRWHSHLLWLHAGNSTPRSRDRSAQGRTWAQLLEGSESAERTVITP